MTTFFPIRDRSTGLPTGKTTVACPFFATHGDIGA